MPSIDCGAEFFIKPSKRIKGRTKQSWILPIGSEWLVFVWGLCSERSEPFKKCFQETRLHLQVLHGGSDRGYSPPTSESETGEHGFVAYLCSLLVAISWPSLLATATRWTSGSAMAPDEIQLLQTIGWRDLQVAEKLLICLFFYGTSSHKWPNNDRINK